MVEYAIYRGDEFQFIGTADECAERLGIKKKSVMFMASPVAKKRFEQRKDDTKAYTAVRLDKE